MAQISYVGTAQTPTNAAEVATLNRHLLAVSESFEIQPAEIQLDAYNDTTEIKFTVIEFKPTGSVEVTPR